MAESRDRRANRTSSSASSSHTSPYRPIVGEEPPCPSLTNREAIPSTGGSMEIEDDALLPKAISTVHSLPIKKRTDKGTQCCIYSITMCTYLYGQAPTLRNNAASGYSRANHNERNNSINRHANNQPQHSDMDTEIEFGVDREMAHEAWRESSRREDAYNAGLDPDEPLFTGYDTDLHGSQGWESDRSWHFH